MDKLEKISEIVNEAREFERNNKGDVFGAARKFAFAMLEIDIILHQ